MYRPVRCPGPCGKVRYADTAHAKLAAVRIAMSEGKTRTWYWSEVCGVYHLTSKTSSGKTGQSRKRMVEKFMPDDACSVEDCGMWQLSRKLCGYHYRVWLKHGDAQAEYEERPVRNENRFWERVTVTGFCWLWSPYRADAVNYYFRVDAKGTLMPVRTYAYELLVGPVPEGGMLDSQCRIHACVNPDHVTLKTLDDFTSPVCTEYNCEDKSFALARCWYHYRWWYWTSQQRKEFIPKHDKGECVLKDCKAVRRRMGLCYTHNKRLKKSGPDSVRIKPKRGMKPLSQEELIRGQLDDFLRKIEEVGECWVWRGRVRKHDGTPIHRTSTAQRYGWLAVHGAFPPEGVRLIRKCSNELCVSPQHRELFQGMAKDRICTADGCYSAEDAKGLCRKHRYQQDRYGSSIFQDEFNYQEWSAEEKDTFWAKVGKADDGCWPWLGTMSRNTPVFHYVSASRIAYVLEDRVLSPQEKLFRQCSTRGCVRPDHQKVKILQKRG